MLWYMYQLKTNHLRQLISVFVFAYADRWFSHVAAHILCPYTMGLPQESDHLLFRVGGGGLEEKNIKDRLNSIARIV